ncbi:MAG: GntR family transcriptional regulator [Cryobacterium sp.]|nr:GntR family transcriptional regulator [Cryobacterium sp.]
MRRRGLIPATIVNSLTLVDAPLEVRAALGLGANARVYEIDRIRLAGGIPMAIERGYYKAELLPDLESKDLTRSLYTIFATEYGLRIDRAEQTVWAETADAGAAKVLGVTEGAPLIVFRRTSAAASVSVEYVTSSYRGDRYQVHMTLNLQHATARSATSSSASSSVSGT